MSAALVEAVSMDAAEYFASPGLSQSGMKDLEVSPLRYWHKHINPNRPTDEPGKALRIGSAIHCAVLEPNRFEERYYCEFDRSQYPELLDTVEDLKEWLSDRALPTSGKRKSDLIERVQAADPNVPILDTLRQRHAEENLSKDQFKRDEWACILGAENALLNEPSLRKILDEGKAEQCFAVRDPETGVLLKARLDWLSSRFILDAKTFAQKMGKSIDKSIADAIFYEHYYRQAYFYSYVWSLANGGSQRSGAQKAPEFILAFVESEPPHEVRLKSLRPTLSGQPNGYWDRARRETRDLIWLYAKCVKEFGDKPWRTESEITPLVDEDIPQLAWS